MAGLFAQPVHYSGAFKAGQDERGANRYAHVHTDRFPDCAGNTWSDRLGDCVAYAGGDCHADFIRPTHKHGDAYGHPDCHATIRLPTSHR